MSLIIPALGKAQPAFFTRRNPRLKTMGAAVDISMAKMGHKPMPWQRYANAITNEIDPYHPRRWRYDLVVVTVPRQAGKSTWELGTLGHRVIAFNRRNSIMTAQTGKDARKRWDSLVKDLDAKKKKADWKVRESGGSERLTYLRRDSSLSPFAPTPKSVHGDTINDVGIDEGWAFDDVSGYELETAVAPTQLTVSDSQMIIVSTRGTHKSTWLNALIKRGRESVNDPNSRMAYLEFSADPEAAARDPFSDETLSFHPAIGHTQDIDKIRSLYTGDLASWYRSILNLESPIAENAVVDLAIWDSLSESHPGPIYGKDTDIPILLPHQSQIHIAYDVAFDRSAACVIGAWVDENGAHIQVLKSGEGTGWLPSTIQDLYHAGYASISCDNVGPTRTITEDLRADMQGAVKFCTVPEYATACQMFLDRVKDGDLTHDAHPDTRRALQVAYARYFGGATAFDPTRSLGNIDHLRAAAVALYRASVAHSTGGLQLFI